MNVSSIGSSSAARPMTKPFENDADASPLEAVLVTLRLGDFQSRWDAAKMIPSYGEAAIPPLIELLQNEADEDEDGDWELRWFLARILGQFNHPAAISALINILLSTDDPEIAAMTATTLATFGPTAVPALTELLSRSSTRLIAVQALAQVQHPAVIPALLDVVNDLAPAVRSAAIEALSHFHDDSIMAVLQTALHDKTAAVRRAAAIALGLQADWRNPAELTQMLSPLLWDLDPEVCRQAAIALGRVGTEEAIAVLAQVFQSAHTPLALKIEIVRALAWIDTAAALAPLKQYLDAEASSISSGPLVLEREMITLLGRVESPEARRLAVDLLLHLLNTKHPLAQTSLGKQQIALSLGQLQDACAIEALIHLLADSDLSVQLHTLSALKQFAAQGAYQRLQTLLLDDVSIDLTLKIGIESALQEWQIHADLA